jgi:glycosyltransferase involved in cell wall biosynthesis
MKALTLRGPFKGITGYDMVVRAFAEQFLARGLRLQMINLPRWSRNRLPRASRDRRLARLWQPVPSRTVVHFCMPHQARPFPRMANVNYTMFEAGRIPQYWVDAHRRHDLIVVTTRACRDAWIASGAPVEKLRTCPLGVDCETYRPDVEPLPLCDDEGRPVASYAVRVLNVSEVVPRKNLDGLYRCWLTATNRGDDAILILKASCGVRAWMEQFMQSLRDVEREVGRTPADAAPILWLMNRRLPDAEMPRLFATATHYWTMSRGEGWDLGTSQAAATGLELLAPHHSAYLDYLDDSVAHLMPAREMPTVVEPGDSLHGLFDGATWWEPDADVAMDLLRRAIDGALPRKGPAARERVAGHFTWSHAAARLLEVLEPVDAVQTGVRRPTGRLLLAALRPI